MCVLDTSFQLLCPLRIIIGIILRVKSLVGRLHSENRVRVMFGCCLFIFSYYRTYYTYIHYIYVMKYIHIIDNMCCSIQFQNIARKMSNTTVQKRKQVVGSSLIEVLFLLSFRLLISQAYTFDEIWFYSFFFLNKMFEFCIIKFYKQIYKNRVRFDASV